MTEVPTALASSNWNCYAVFLASNNSTFLVASFTGSTLTRRSQASLVYKVANLQLIRRELLNTTVKIL